MQIAGTDELKLPISYIKFLNIFPFLQQEHLLSIYEGWQGNVFGTKKRGMRTVLALSYLTEDVRLFTLHANLAR